MMRRTGRSKELRVFSFQFAVESWQFSVGSWEFVGKGDRTTVVTVLNPIGVENPESRFFIGMRICSHGVPLGERKAGRISRRKSEIGFSIKID
jgi:hypothetical protein